jgi:hypothetical protein
MHNSLVIKKYDPQWPILFEELQVIFSELMGTMVSAIEHVGSTSVPGFAALEPENPPPFLTRCVLPSPRVDQEIQHMLENTRLLAKAA